ncbi:hypothetical protein P3339_16155 [Microbulbifer sp. MLAF003]|uniref:hypothetical protein n=1 Tax=Microbulbifer sp. MLAF003 TaxID=3032582 RepID=UPI0024AD3D89|nr:hypothetical protein [Microbulbifer sp. MLAF003]WHI49975.1 hypothetical protein P3339_16155 [Microbulbifer sp. MLAF003]
MKSLKSLGLALMLLSGDVLALGDANESTVRYIEVFSSASSRDGEVVVKLDAETESCHQYWIKSEESVGQKTQWLLSWRHSMPNLQCGLLVILTAFGVEAAPLRPVRLFHCVFCKGFCSLKTGNVF